MDGLHIGVDGGGSRCRVRIADAGGCIVAAAEGGSANVYLDFDKAVATIGQTIDDALHDLGLGGTDTRHAHLGLGLAGVSSPAVAARVAARFETRFSSTMVSNDAVIACLGAHAGADGGLVIAGTGSAAVLRLHEEEINFGGRGFLLGDDGSGAVMARQAWRRALRAHDGLEPWTPLLRALMAEFGDDPVAVIAWGRLASSGQFGSYVPMIVAAAMAGDAAALPIVQEAGRSIDELIEALVRRGAPRISLVGGLATPLHPFLAGAAKLSPPILDALDGALLLTDAPLPGRR